MPDNPLKLASLAQGQVESSFNTGDLRRRYDFANVVSELAISQTPFFRFLSKTSKRSTTDPEFKTLEQRNMWHKRYAYVLGYSTWNGSAATSTLTFAHGNLGSSKSAGDKFALSFGADYETAGNVQSVLGQSGIAAGASGTKPIFLLKDQLIKIPVMHDSVDDYIVVKVMSDPVDDGQQVEVGVQVVRGASASSGNITFKGSSGSAFVTAAGSLSEQMKCYVVGTAFAEGSGFPDTYKDTPYLDVVGYTQIWKTTMQMTNTARATELKLAADEWKRVWKNKLIEHKWDIETDLLFSSKYKDSDGIRYTQGVVDYVLSSGNAFSLTTSGSSQTTSDDFLEDMSNFLDPRYNNANATLFMCDTATYNWLHKLGGFQKANIEISSQFRFDFAISGKKSLFGLPVTQISTPYGNMNIVRNIHLDGSQVKILAVNMKYASYRPLVGNGVNRDTAVYVGVQSLENTGVDRRIDLIQTEAGLEVIMPEAHAVWK